MKRSTPLRRTPFKSRPPARVERVREPPPAYTVDPSRWRTGQQIQAAAAPVEKERPIQHEAYMSAVRRLPCAHCGVQGFTQFCHSDEGKGAMLKTDCRRGWPGCGPHDNTMGCHYLLGSTGKLGRDERRRLEALYSRQTRGEIARRGEWPKTLPPWPGDEPANDTHCNTKERA